VPGDCPEDRNGDGKVTLKDVLIVIKSLPKDNPQGDVDDDGDVDLKDLKLIIRALFKPACH
jgi:hypothetical protein